MNSQIKQKMTIEFHYTLEAIKKKEIDFIRDRFIDFQHAFNKISRAEIYCNHSKINDEEYFNFIINIDFFDFTFYISRSGTDIQETIASVLDVIENKIDELIKENRQPLEDLISTVEVI